MVNIFIADAFTDLVDEGQLEQAALLTLQQQSQSPESDLSLVIEDDTHLRDLNQSFLGIDAPTDVLSFPSGDEADPETGRAYLGDVIISYPRAGEQAEVGGHTVMAELQLLVIHGTLHLLGHDHAVPDEKEVMWTAQRDILSRLGVQLFRLPE